MSNNAVIVCSFDLKETFFDQGGCGYWRAKKSRIENRKYLFVTRNRRRPEDGVAAKTGFLIGEISSCDQIKNGRLIIRLSRYADISIPNLWTSSSQNPVAYADMSELKEKYGFDVNSLDWKEFPTKSASEIEKESIRPITIKEAKEGIAKLMDISVDQIEILIKA